MKIDPIETLCSTCNEIADNPDEKELGIAYSFLKSAIEEIAGKLGIPVALPESPISPGIIASREAEWAERRLGL